MFTCTYCDKKFKYESEKKRHERSHIPQYECSQCLKKFSFVSALKRHQKQHQRTGSVECDECGKSFRDEILLQRHKKYAHKETHICIKCNAKFNSLQALQSHQKTHKPKTERRYHCNNNGCTKTFNFKHHLKHHELTHFAEKQHYCNNCGKGFIQLHHLKTHLRTHKPQTWLQCMVPSCDKFFTTEYALRRHLATHKKKAEDMSGDEISSSWSDLKEVLNDNKVYNGNVTHNHNSFNKNGNAAAETSQQRYQNQVPENMSYIDIKTDKSEGNNLFNEQNNIQNADQSKCRDDIQTKCSQNDTGESKCSSCSTKVFKRKENKKLPELEYREDGIIKLKELIDTDIEIINFSSKEDNKVEKFHDFSNDLIPYNSCKAILGKCIVSGSGSINEECLCVRMAIDDNQMISQEIDEITPHPVLSAN